MKGIKWLSKLHPKNTALIICLFLLLDFEIIAMAKFAKAIE